MRTPVIEHFFYIDLVDAPNHIKKTALKCGKNKLSFEKPC